MELFYVSCVMGYFYHTPFALIFFFSIVMLHGVFFSVVTPKATR
jgi:hypothetical protein